MPRLTAKFVAAIDRPGKFYDGDAGLFVIVQAHAGRLRKSYAQRLTIDGRRVAIGLGSVKWTTPSEARAKAQANLKIARTGGDPRVGKSRVPSFADAVEAVIALHAPTWKDRGKSEKQWRASMATYALPALGHKAVSAITASDVLAVVGPLWTSKRETGRRVRQRIAAIMKWSIAEGHRESNPVDAIGAALPRNGSHKTHHRALPFDRVGGALAAVAASGAWWATKLAFRFLVLCAARSGEVRGMRWEEVEADTWTVPGERMKVGGREHRVPLSPEALAVLTEAREHADGSGLVFPSITGRVMSDSTVSKLLKENQIGAVPHGFRSSFRDWAAERTNVPREIAEHALAHVEGSASELAYRRTDYFDRRRDLMNQWAEFIAARVEE